MRIVPSDLLLPLLLSMILLAPVARAAPDLEDQVIAVSSRVSTDYVRVRQPDGSFAPETYAFGPGGRWLGASDDASIDQITFLETAKKIAGPLASQNYLSSRDPGSTKLLIMVYWGTTHPPEGSSSTMAYQAAARASANLSSAMGASKGQRSADVMEAEREYDGALAVASHENERRDHANFTNAKMLGYDSWWKETTRESRGTAFDLRRQDLIGELEDNRYFVILMAYDFQLMWKEKKTKLLWETRFSIREHGNAFNEQLSAMAQQAARHFGQDSKGLLHQALPNTRVDLGETQVIEYQPTK